MRILTCDEVRQAEREAARRPGMSTLVLRQRAGYAVAQFCASHFKFDSVCVMCGAGGNGANGLAAVESLQGFAAQVSVIILAKDASELSEDATAMRSRLSVEPLWIGSEGNFDAPAVKEALSADLILDAVADADDKTPLPEPSRRAIHAINDAFGIVVSVDAPSGADADSPSPLDERGENLVFAQGIITFVAPRPAHVFGELTSGPIVVSEIGVQPVLVPHQTGLSVTTGQEVGITFPPRPHDANKGQFGHVLVVAGSLGKAGAAGLAGMASLSTGAGLVTVACPSSIQATVAGFAPELMTEGLPETDEGSIAMAAKDKVDRLLAGKDAIVLGPGLSHNPATEEFVRWLVTRCPLPLVLDADGLNAFAGRAGELSAHGGAAPFRVLTPHPGEAARLMGISVKEIQTNRVEMARRVATETGSCLALKGWRTVVTGPSGETWINMSGNAAMAKGGSGDVLSGMIGAALARHHASRPQDALSASGPQSTSTIADPRVQKYQAQQLQRNTAQMAAFLQDVSVAAAVHLHGLAGDIARDQLQENTVLATDLLDAPSEAFRECDSQMDRGLFYLQR